MIKTVSVSLIVAAVVFGIDQFIKSIFLDGFIWHSKAISLYFVLNKGVAFSMFAFLGEWLKYIQIAVLSALLFFVFCFERDFFKNHFISVGLILGGGVGNIVDRFLHGGVVDYVAWHYWFDFAVFNFADVMIDLGIVLILLQIYFRKKRKTAK